MSDKLQSIYAKIIIKVMRVFYDLFDKLYTSIDKRHILRTRNIRLVPSFKNRRGGKISYLEWGHVIGIFQTMINMNLDKKSGNTIVDIGCGTGLLAIACEPFVLDGGKYIGIDVSKRDIDFCIKNFKEDHFQFQHFNVLNLSYSKNQKDRFMNWDIPDRSVDMLTALSVWTHLNEEDAIYYFKEINRTLKPMGKAIVTLFFLDDDYQRSLDNRDTNAGKFFNTASNDWIFDQPCSKTGNWFTPEWTGVPENAIGITPDGLKSLLSGTELKLLRLHTGNWKLVPGVYFQDILVFQKG